MCHFKILWYLVCVGRVGQDWCWLLAETWAGTGAAPTLLSRYPQILPCRIFVYFFVICKYLNLLYFWLWLCLVWFWSALSILPLEVEWFIIPKVDRPFQLDSPELNLFMEPRTGKWNKFHLLDKSRFHTSNKTKLGYIVPRVDQGSKGSRGRPTGSQRVKG